MPPELLAWLRANPQAAIQAMQAEGIIDVPPQAATATDSAAFAAQSRGNAPPPPPPPPPTAMGIMGVQAQGVGSPSSWPQPPLSPQQKVTVDERVDHALRDIELERLRGKDRARNRSERREGFWSSYGLACVVGLVGAALIVGMRWGRK
jgi:hypothetical protein